MEDKSKLFLTFGAGVLVGAGLVALFTTDEGKAIIEKAESQADDLAEELKKTAGNLEKEFTDFLKTQADKENPAT